MAPIRFVTGDRGPQLLPSDRLVAQALVDRGQHGEAAPWPGDFARVPRADRLLRRSPWASHHEMTGFTTWRPRRAAATLPVYNPVAVVRWPRDQRARRDVQACGVLLPAAAVLQGGAHPAASARQHGWSRAVIKPLAGAGGHGVDRVAYAELGAWAGQGRAHRAAGAGLRQACRAEMQVQGERSRVFLAGVCSPAVVTQPQAGECRLNDQDQGHLARVEPASAVIAQAHAVGAGLPVMPLYARGDGGITGTGACCLRAWEVNEPALDVDAAPEHAAGVAEALQAPVAGRGGAPGQPRDGRACYWRKTGKGTGRASGPAPAQPGPAGDGTQRPRLCRSRCPPRLRPSVSSCRFSRRSHIESHILIWS
jgi:hypothetical protein